MIPDCLAPYLGGEVSYLEPFIRNAIVVDIGAHQGAFTLWAVEHEARWVYAFEPLPANYLKLLENISTIRNVDPYLAAVGRADGRCDLVVPYGETSGTFATSGTDCLVMGWDTVLAKVAPIDVLKVDIEGAEYDLFPDADLSSVERFVIETHAWTTEYEPRREGVGQRLGKPRRQGAYEELMEWLARTHDLTIEGDEAGGFIVGSRK